MSDPQGPVKRAYANGSRDWHLKPAVIIGIFAFLLSLTGAAIGGGFWGGHIDERVASLELIEATGVPRTEARRALKEIDKRLDGIEQGQGVLKEKARQAEEDRRRINDKLDRILDRTNPARRGLR